MTPDRHPWITNKTPFWIGLGFLLLVAVLELTGILINNHGKFVYTLDDAYIHLAMAENIRIGHYGVNLGESSAPESSILWPFILAPFTATTFGELVPLFLNMLFAIGTLWYMWKIVEISFRVNGEGVFKVRTFIVSFFVIILLVMTNTIGLVFTGMEHSLQVLLTVMIVWGMISEIETRKVSIWMIIAVVVAPLVRYENLALSIAAIGYLFYRKHHKLAMISGILTVLPILAFSAFLMRIVNSPLPISVQAKSGIISSGGRIGEIWDNLRTSLSISRGMLLCLSLIGMLFLIGFSKQSLGRKQLAGVVSFAIIAHLLVGQYGWYARYEAYIWTATCVTLLYLWGQPLMRLLANNTSGKGWLKVIILFGLSVGLTCTPYLYVLVTIPVASNNIYDQHYQMHRFAVDYYKKPIAVNDLGYVSYRNDNYVLDYSGLASMEVLSICRRKGKDFRWMDRLAVAHGVQFAMIYEHRFGQIPDNWIKVGDLLLSRRLITPAEKVVAFYAMNNTAFQETKSMIKDFQASLPPGVKFVIGGEW
jgi:hypothetical protein